VIVIATPLRMAMAEATVNCRRSTSFSSMLSFFVSSFISSSNQ